MFPKFLPAYGGVGGASYRIIRITKVEFIVIITPPITENTNKIGLEYSHKYECTRGGAVS